jgi:hypothetical protein
MSRKNTLTGALRSLIAEPSGISAAMTPDGELVAERRALTRVVSSIRAPPVGKVLGALRGRALPKVFVLDPPLEPRGPSFPDRVPHLYRHIAPPYLCLFDPDTDDWDRTMSVSDTIIPWISRWLASYEIWRVTGEWPHPGRHPELAEWPSGDASHPPVLRPAPKARSIARGSAFLGQQIGTFASLPLMAAASEGCSRSPSLLDWSRPTLAEIRSQIASTWSSEPPLAASPP